MSLTDQVDEESYEEELVQTVDHALSQLNEKNMEQTRRDLISNLLHMHLHHHIPRHVQESERRMNSQDMAVQTMSSSTPKVSLVKTSKNTTTQFLNGECPLSALTDQQISTLLSNGQLKHRLLESLLSPDYLRAVTLRRQYLSNLARASSQMGRIPCSDYDYAQVSGACCENLIGYVPIPLGIAGPLMINGRKVFVPLATTEGALVASTNRGCQAIMDAGGDGVWARVFDDGMTRAPVLQFESVAEALKLREWLMYPANYGQIKKVFEATSRFLKLIYVEGEPEGRLLFVRFKAITGDAMGMNMITKAVSATLSYLREQFPSFVILSLSGNFCVDKKATAINWIRGRGKSVIAEAIIPSHVIRSRLHTEVDQLVRLGCTKLHTGSNLAVGIGANNAHAANLVAAVFLATGQDVAQLMSSGMCSTSLECKSTGDLLISCTMRCLEVGTVGGGTILPGQNAALGLMGCAGPGQCSGENAKRLAEIICATVLAGELSLLAAQCSDDLVASHLRLNRSSRNLVSEMTPTTSSMSLSLVSRSTGEKTKIECSNIL